MASRTAATTAVQQGSWWNGLGTGTICTLLILGVGHTAWFADHSASPIDEKHAWSFLDVDTEHEHQHETDRAGTPRVGYRAPVRTFSAVNILADTHGRVRATYHVSSPIGRLRFIWLRVQWIHARTASFALSRA